MAYQERSTRFLNEKARGRKNLGKRPKTTIEFRGILKDGVNIDGEQALTSPSIKGGSRETHECARRKRGQVEGLNAYSDRGDSEQRGGQCSKHLFQKKV